MGRTSSLTAEAAPCCAVCGSAEIIKNGRNACGNQQFRARRAGPAGCCAPQSPTASPERQAEVLRAVVLERLGQCATARVFAVG